ncbi:MAG: HAMP domain-containing sensor histidine kinase [Pseudomonadota bacterium]
MTETRELQALVQRQERLSAMGEMLARLAHQARTPLATAILYASQLRRTPLQGNAAVFTSRIVTRLKHLENMIDDMLCFARGNPGGSTPLVVTELLDGALGALATGAAERVTVQTPPSTYTVRGNRRALCGALSNLIENALSMRPTTKVMLSVALSDDERHIVLRVIDDGPGIDDSLHERIFEPFFTTRNNGTGLGLAVVRSVADGHGGRAYVARSAPNEGATLHLELPRADVTALATTEVPKLPHLERSHAR